MPGITPEFQSAEPPPPSRFGKKFKKWSKRLIAALVVGLVVWFIFGRGEKEVEYVTEKVRIGSIRQISDVNGTVESNTKRNLKFQTSGKIASLAFDESAVIKAGDILAELDAGIPQIEVDRAQASLQRAQAELDLRYAGPSLEDAQISNTKIEEAQMNLAHAAEKYQDTKRANGKQTEKAEQEVQNTKTTLSNAEIAYENAKGSGSVSERIAGKGLGDELEEAKKTSLSAIDSIRSALSFARAILNPESEEEKKRQIYIGFESPQEKIVARNEYKRIKSILVKAEAEFLKKESEWDQAPIEEFLKMLETDLSDTKKLMDTVFTLLTNSITGTNLSSTDVSSLQSQTKTEQTSLLNSLDAVRDMQHSIQNATLGIEESDITSSTGVDAAQTNLDNAINAHKLSLKNLEDVKIRNRNLLNTQKREMDLLKLSIRKAKQSHAKLVAQPRNVDVASLQANVNDYLATWKKAKKNLENTIISAPSDGIITKVNREIGENVTSADTIVTMITDGLQIKANIPETDIADISVGNPVEITLDAFDITEIFTGKILAIDPAETVIQGVIYYEASIGLERNDPRIKPGMTTDLDILSAEKNDALTVSPEAVQYEDDQPFVFVLENNEKIRKDITIGLEGDDAIEISSGISEGDRVILYEKIDS